MEFNPTRGEKSDQRTWSLDDNQVSGHVKYTCTFCRRGFSNAQALGGHMNIHRKDKAKLKESCDDDDQSPLSVDISQDTPSHDLQLHNSVYHDDSSQLESREEKWISSGIDQEAVSRGKDGVGELRQLPLFAEKPSREGGLEEASSNAGYRVEKSELTRGSRQPADQLDLELRLGLEHHETSTTGT